jgi:hypothetical protein
VNVRIPHSRRAIALHVVVLLAFSFCWAAGWFELTRARAGHTIAWVYTFEWPFYAIALLYMWFRAVTERPTRAPAPWRRSTDIPDDDPGLQAWRGYLAELGHDDTTTDRAPGSG